MAAQRQIPGGKYVNEVGTVQRQIPGGAYVNETSGAAVTFNFAFTSNANILISQGSAMRRNVAGQFIGAQLVSKTDGSAVTSGTTTVYVTGDAGTQAAGSVGAGACTHEGQGFWTYAPAQAETNYTQVAFTFTNTNAVSATVQVFPTQYDSTGNPIIADASVDAIWDEVLTAATHNVASSAGRRLRTASGGQLDSGTAQTGGVDSITLATSASTTAGLYVGCQIAIDGGTGAGQSRYIVGYTTGRVAYVARHWTTTPDNTSTYVLFADNQVPFIHMGLAQAGAASTITFQSTASATNDIYNGQLVRVLSGTGDDQIRAITDYDGATKVATVEPAWTVQPDNTSYYGTLQAGYALPTRVIDVNVEQINNTQIVGNGVSPKFGV